MSRWTELAEANINQFPWEQWADEPEYAYEAFLAYLGMDRRNRSLTGAYRIFIKRPDIKEAGGQFKDWSKQWHWAERVEAWNRHIDAQDLARIEQETLEWRANRRALLHGVFGKVAQYVEGLDPTTKKANAHQIVQMAQGIVDQLRKEYEVSEGKEAADEQLPTIIFANVNTDAYRARTEEVIEGTAIEIEEG